MNGKVYIGIKCPLTSPHVYDCDLETIAIETTGVKL
jgi:hypothetical protein